MIDFREHDAHEHGMTQTQRVEAVCIDLKLAQRIRDDMRAQGLRVPLTAEEEFAEANARMGVKP
jgi:hypothetical protein